MAEKFLNNLAEKTDFESLITLIQLPYLLKLSEAYMGDCKPYNLEEKSRTFQTVFGSNYSKKCQKEFLEKLVEVSKCDWDVLLSLTSLCGWWKKPDIFDELEYFIVQRYFPEAEADKDTAKNVYPTLQEEYDFALRFDQKILKIMIGKIVSKVDTFGAVSLLYGVNQKFGMTRASLLALGCRLALTEDDFILVTRWLFNTKCVHLKKRLKPFFKKLIATL